MSERRRLIGVAYRLLGSVADAEDAVQETYARWYAMSPEQRDAIETPGAWLTTVASRICLDVLGSARVRRERYVGEWVPEPVPGGAEWANGPWGGAPADPADRVTLDESISMAFLVVLESMTPAERVSFILHDVFRYSFAEVAEVVGRTPAACRQLASRPGGTSRHRTPRRPPCRTGRHRPGVQGRLGGPGHRRPGRPPGSRRDDGRRRRRAGRGAAHPDRGPRGDRAPPRRLPPREAPARRVLEATVNGQPGLVAQEDGVTVTVVAFDVVGGQITRIWAVRNPEKLRSWTAGVSRARALTATKVGSGACPRWCSNRLPTVLRGPRRSYVL